MPQLQPGCNTSGGEPQALSSTTVSSLHTWSIKSFIALYFSFLTWKTVHLQDGQQLRGAGGTAGLEPAQAGAQGALPEGVRDAACCCRPPLRHHLQQLRPAPR